MEYQTLSPNIGVENVNETVKFYTEVLGFTLAMSNPETGELEWAMVAQGNVTIMFQEMHSLKKEYSQLADRAAVAALTFYVKMKGMKELYEKVKDTEYLAVEIHQTFYGAEEFALFDNNGYILTISED
ncbi:VOC family protein [Bacteroides ihuae]|uniref:VOC family protein n=1 Tax=Bacteroides ihuae TaxID=1852362 RepID=UPI0008DB0236|nr:VOC family protein [Bacteroides ihuae]